MRQSPSIIPGVDHDIYLVHYGRRRSWCETDVEDTDLETVVADMLEGQFKNPVRVIGFNTAEGWSRDVSEDVAHELRQRWLMARRISCGIVHRRFADMPRYRRCVLLRPVAL